MRIIAICCLIFILAHTAYNYKNKIRTKTKLFGLIKTICILFHLNYVKLYIKTEIQLKKIVV